MEEIPKIERLTNLVICLLYANRPVEASYIHANVLGYKQAVTEEAFKRMFERDKKELRDQGIPIETVPVSWANQVESYRIKRDEYRMGDITLDSEEAAAVAVASAMWQSPELAASAQAAVRKLRANGIEVRDAAEAALSATVGTPKPDVEETLRALVDGINQGHPVRFRHRSRPSAPYVDRTLHPWGMATVRGNWYVIGHDADKDAPRTFRVSRVRDVAVLETAEARPRPKDFDLRAAIEAAVNAYDKTVRARVWLADGRGNALRRAALSVETDQREVAGATRSGAVVTVEMRSLDDVAAAVAGLGPDAVALDPPELRAAVVARLTGAARAVTPADHADREGARR
ncbi:helix-turn-helix transcriptional regulator [Tsukamurella soli]|uniref:helix-turn-helix transcriptional regulator n=1 Tax=Tsukamurella soli TaxID=644556 RepID=UPI00360EB5B8